LKEAGSKRPEVGGTLELAWTSETPPKTRGHNPTKHFTARWTPPVSSLLGEEKSGFNFDTAPVSTNSAEPGSASSPLDNLRGMQTRGNSKLPANLQDTTPPF
jgi:hypothetical protein